MIRPLACAAWLLLAPAAVPSQQAGWPGPQPDGSILLPNGWSLRPHGEQIPLDSDLPIRLAWHPNGRHLAVQHAGYREHEVVVFDTKIEEPVATLPLGKTWSGMAWSRDGRHLWVSGGVTDRVLQFAFDPDHAATEQVAERVAEIDLGSDDRIDLVAGMCAAADGTLLVCLQRSDRLCRVSPAGGAADAAATLAELPDGSMPFECALSPDGATVWVSLWARAEVWALDAKTGGKLAAVAAGEHPSELLIAPDGLRLFVSNGNENTVTVIDTVRRAVEETLSSALYPLAPPGSTPNSLALHPDGRILLVANADNNNCAVLDVGERGRAQGLGFIPLGAYPTSIRFSPDGARVWVANGKGSSGSRANPKGPQPERGNRYDRQDYTGALFGGSLSTFAFPAPRELQALSARAYACAPLRPAAEVRAAGARPADSPIPAEVGGPSPIRYCVYVIKENRTYDQVFGDLPQGNGDPELCLFPRAVSPNHHAIAETFVLLDNFYVESEVSADGHEWTMGGYATDFVERTWPVQYSGKGRHTLGDGTSVELGYPSEGRFAIAAPKNRYLFHLAKAAGVSFRSYGEFVDNAAEKSGPGSARLDVLEGHFDPGFRSFDMDYLDVDRADRFLQELARFEASGELPRLIVLRLPNDHTAGTALGKLTPRAYVADNDLALGRVLEGLSKSRFWPAMAVFVVEDDAQNGPDHVDAHRTVGLVAGPHVKRGAVVSTMYSTCSMLRTIELILGLQPMSQFDAAARPMYDCFAGEPDPRAYEHLAATYPLDERNGKTVWGHDLSERFDFSREDAADDLLLNEVVWRSIKGADSPMPRPRRAAFVRVLDD